MGRNDGEVETCCEWNQTEAEKYRVLRDSGGRDGVG